MQNVKISTATAGATLSYTTNGTTPSMASPEYTGPLTVGSTETLKAIAVAIGFAPSAVATAKYTIELPAVAASAEGPATER